MGNKTKQRIIQNLSLMFDEVKGVQENPFKYVTPLSCHLINHYVLQQVEEIIIWLRLGSIWIKNIKILKQT